MSSCFFTVPKTLYYGTIDPTDLSNIVNGQAWPLKVTIYGDFDGDCDVDNADYNAIANYATQFTTCDCPSWDYNGDCVVDLSDVAIVQGRIGQNDPNCYAGQTDNCPWTNTPLESGGYVESTPEAVASFSDAFLAFLEAQAPVDSDDQRSLDRTIDLSVTVAGRFLTFGERGTLADAIEETRGQYASEEVEAMISDIVSRLRE